MVVKQKTSGVVRNNSSSTQEKTPVSLEQSKILLNSAVSNFLMTRSQLFNKMMDKQGRDIDAECGYPINPNYTIFKQYYDREGIATRVVNVFPDESWSVYPELYETEKEISTPFEKAWNKLLKKQNIWHYLHRIDRVSGLGQYGLLLLGINDNKRLDQPVDGIDPVTGEMLPDRPKGLELTYLRVFDEGSVTAIEYEDNEYSPRVGKPRMYTIQFGDPTNAMTVTNTSTKKVHWTRLIHVFDNRATSEVFGTPRMQPVINRLFDLRKILSGSGEMFWKGAFPGYSFETTPDMTNSEFDVDEDSLREQIFNYMNGLQRYLALIGVTAKSLAPQVSDPTNHVNQQLAAIALSLNIPLRIFMGSEAAHLASTQDIGTFNRRLGLRQRTYLDPMLIRPFVDRLIAFGILPVVEDYTIEWKDLNSLTDETKADVALKRSQALLAFVTGGVERLVPPLEFLTNILEIPLPTAKMIVDKAEANRKNLLTVVEQTLATNPTTGGNPNSANSKKPRRPTNPGTGPAA
jgi:hypothetical protein